VNDRPVRAVIFDLDDTLFPQAAFLSGAFGAVAEELHRRTGFAAKRALAALLGVASEGSDKGRIIDRALDRIEVSCEVAPLVDVFLSYRPEHLELYPGVGAALDRLDGLVKTGMITDGAVDVQAAKVVSVGLQDRFDVVVYSDALGREHRKPDPAPFLEALALLDVEPAESVFIGDRPDKDVSGSMGVGMRAIRVRTGEHAAQPDGEAWCSFDTLSEAVDFVICSGAIRRT
jgi:putative hydrolase of the HAD superfamily